MKKRIASLLAALALCLTLLPMAAFAEDAVGAAQSSRTVITTVDELMQFAADVNAGAYDGKTDAVVSLEADLDLSVKHGRRLDAPTTTLTFRIFSAENFTATDIRFPIWTFPMPMA